MPRFSSKIFGDKSSFYCASGLLSCCHMCWSDLWPGSDKCRSHPNLSAQFWCSFVINIVTTCENIDAPIKLFICSSSGVSSQISVNSVEDCGQTQLVQSHSASSRSNCDCKIHLNFLCEVLQNHILTVSKVLTNFHFDFHELAIISRKNVAISKECISNINL